MPGSSRRMEEDQADSDVPCVIIGAHVAGKESTVFCSQQWSLVHMPGGNQRSQLAMENTDARRLNTGGGRSLW